MIRVAITGAAGRMGKTLIQAIEEADGLQLGAALEHPDNPAVGQDAGEIAGVGNSGVLINADAQNCIGDFDVVIDFTVPCVMCGCCSAPASPMPNCRLCIAPPQTSHCSWRRI